MPGANADKQPNIPIPATQKIITIRRPFLNIVYFFAIKITRTKYIELRTL